MSLYLLDTDIVIGCLRGEAWAREVLLRCHQRGHLLSYTPITSTEIYRGLRHGEEEITSEFFATLTCIQLTCEMGETAGKYQQQFRASHGVELADALIAAASVHSHAILLTTNAKHYPMPDLQIEVVQRIP